MTRLLSIALLLAACAAERSGEPALTYALDRRCTGPDDASHEKIVLDARMIWAEHGVLIEEDTKNPDATLCIAESTPPDGFFTLSTGAIQVWGSHPGASILVAQRFAQLMVGEWIFLEAGKRGVMSRRSEYRTPRFTAPDLELLRAHGLDL